VAIRSRWNLVRNSQPSVNSSMPNFPGCRRGGLRASKIQN